MNLANQPVRAVPKPKHKRRTPKKAARGRFSRETRITIIERDKGFCVRCGSLYDDIHHIIYRSQGGRGSADNGVCVCRECHEWAHSSKEGRKWFEDYRERYLLGG